MHGKLRKNDERETKLKNQIMILHDYITQVEKGQDVQMVEIVELGKETTRLQLENSRIKTDCERLATKERELQEFIVKLQEQN